MTQLTVWRDGDADTVDLRTEDPSRIAAELKELGVRFERWELPAVLSPGAGQEEVLAAFRAQIDAIVAEEGFTFVDVATLHPGDNGDDPEWRQPAAAARAKFRSEHTHDDDEVRFFVAGAGVFYLHVAAKVHAIYCEAGDLLGVPRNTTHWFDTGEVPDFTAIRFFHNDNGWVGTFTGSDLADRFAGADELRTTLEGFA